MRLKRKITKILICCSVKIIKHRIKSKELFINFLLVKLIFGMFVILPYDKLKTQITHFFKRILYHSVF